MSQGLIAEELIAEAQRATGLEDFGGDSFREGLEILLGDINRDAGRPPEFVARNRGAVLKALSDRLQVIQAHAARPEICELAVERPVFVLGIPRTGTTLLSNLLAADPGRRPLLTWEIAHPVPAPTTATLYSDPRALAMLEAGREMLARNPGAGKYYRNAATYPNEDVFVLAHEFKTLMWESYGRLPNYRDWIFQADMTSGYAYHKKFLQLHQADAPGVWSLKMPSHSLHILDLLKVYPDARLVWTHRDPFTAAASLCSLARLAHSTFAGRVDMAWIAESCPWQAAQHANRAMDARDALAEDRLIDVHYADLLRDPLAAMRRLYGALGDEFTPEAEAGMSAWIADNPQGKFGRHEYQLAEFGLSKAALEPLFERYLSRYEVEPEG